MKASELRIGNLVYNPVQKINIVVNGGLISTEQHREKAIKEYKGFEPIPLNDEWLLKFGFEGWDKGDYTINLSNASFYKLPIWQPLAKNIKHVHQLQNL
jgi:hypothetical protein